MPELPDHVASRDAAATEASRQAARFNLVAVLRLICFILLALAVTAVIQTPGILPIVTSGACLAGFLGLAFWHGIIDDRRRRARALVAYHEQGSARLAGQWDHGQEDGSRLLPDGHPFARDLDLVGADGLYARLNTAGSPAARRVLAEWLFATEATVPFADRAAVVGAWSAAHDWRASIAVLAGDHGDADNPDDDPVGVWLREQGADQAWRRWLPLVWAVRVLVPVLVMVTAINISADSAILLAVLLSVVLVPFERVAIKQAGVGDADLARRRTQAQAAALARLAAAPGDHAAINGLRSRAAAAAAALTDLGAVLDRHAKRGNALWAMIGALFANEWRNLGALKAWAAAHGEQRDAYLHTLGEGEALSCLATWAAEQGGCAVTVADDGPIVACEDLAHPLLPAASRVGNAISLDDGQVLLLTGANASGKSTFIRSLCLAVVLARLGLPVPAASCRLRSLRLATVMRVTDDLRGGRSRFQAEVERLRDMLQMLDDGGDPVCLALDEILGGTNSLERHHGTRAVLDHARGGHGIVLVSTHDLELATLAEAEPERFVLAHFADRAALGEVEGAGDMVFDYTLRPGVLQTTNALRVMRHYGLPVADDAVPSADSSSGTPT